MRLYLLISLIAAASSCKTPNASQVQSTGAFDTSTGRACLVWIKDNDVFYKHCPLQSQCEPIDGRVVMSEAEYTGKLNQHFGVDRGQKSRIDQLLKDLEQKYENFLSIKAELEKIRDSNPAVYASEMQKADERVFGTSLAMEEVNAFRSGVNAREREAEKVLEGVRDLRNKNMSVLLIPEIAAALTPIFGKDISNCFEESKSPQIAASVTVQREASSEWTAYESWLSSQQSLPYCTRHAPHPGFELLMKDWYELNFPNQISHRYTSQGDCQLARQNARRGIFCSWSQEGTNFARISDGKAIGFNPTVRLVVEERGQKIFPKARTLETCFAELAHSNNIMRSYPGFTAVPRYNYKAERLGNNYDIVAIWNARLVAENIHMPNATPPSNTVSIMNHAVPRQPSTNSIFSGQAPTGTGNGSVTSNANNNSGPTTNTNTTNNSPQVQRLIAGMKAAKAGFNYVEGGTRDACLAATKSSSEPWSDLMAHYYCLFPIQDTNNAYSVRACFTGSLRGQAPYQKANGRAAAYSGCINRPEFAWLKADQERAAVFELIMVDGPSNISVSDQNKVISGFYGQAPVPVR